jgi:Mg2+/Co2+ transporter CorB
VEKTNKGTVKSQIKGENVSYYDGDGSGISVTDALRIMAFFVGLILLYVGLSNIYSASTSTNVTTVMTGIPVAILMAVMGFFLILAAIDPKIIRVLITWNPP